jgi:phosphoribosylglycinamide formyltransferase 1
MKIAVICSAGGSAFFAAYDLLIQNHLYTSDNFIIITDRSCGAENEADIRHIEKLRVDFKTKEQFSKNVSAHLLEKNVSMVLMLFSRLIGEEIYSRLPTLNVHPALLPSFKGMNAVGQALDSGAKFLGATLHTTTALVDDGAMFGQVISPIGINASKADLDKLSFIQKTYLIMAFLECVKHELVEFSSPEFTPKWRNDPICSASANPCISVPELKKSFDEFQKSALGSSVIQ